MIIVLIHAGDDDTQSIFVADSKEQLIEVVGAAFDVELNNATPGEADMYQTSRTELIGALENHEAWEPGRYVLNDHCKFEWYYQEWTLFITDIPGSSVVDL